MNGKIIPVSTPDSDNLILLWLLRDMWELSLPSERLLLGTTVSALAVFVDPSPSLQDIYDLWFWYYTPSLPGKSRELSNMWCFTCNVSRRACHHWARHQSWGVVEGWTGTLFLINAIVKSRTASARLFVEWDDVLLVKMTTIFSWTSLDLISTEESV